MEAKFGFCMKFYARIQIFRLVGPTKLFLWLQIFQELYGLSDMKTNLGETFPPSSFLYGEAI